MNIADIVQTVLVSKKNPSIDDLLDYNLSKPIPIIIEDDFSDLPF